MESKGKKAYSRPELIVHGDVEKLTQQGGGNVTDVPQGTPITNNDVNTVIGPS